MPQYQCVFHRMMHIGWVPLWAQKEDNRPIVSMSSWQASQSFQSKGDNCHNQIQIATCFGIRNSRESSPLWECKMWLRYRTSGIFRSGNIWQILEPLWIDMIVRRSSAGRILHFPALEATPDSKCSPGGQLGIYSGDKAELEKETNSLEYIVGTRQS